MKLFAAGLMCVAFAAVSAQDKPDSRVHFACTAVTPAHLLKCQTTLGPEAGRRFVSDDRHYSSIADFARKAKVGDHWWPGKSTDVIVVTLAASDIEQDQRTYRLTGEAEIHTATSVFTSDNAIYHADTGEIEGRGDVRVKPVVP
jgi:lipopolysaccharide assembly outer membrane protein LptD (OstA)